jgi:hypothetical protein
MSVCINPCSSAFGICAPASLSSSAVLHAAPLGSADCHLVGQPLVSGVGYGGPGMVGRSIGHQSRHNKRLQKRLARNGVYPMYGEVW